MKLRTKLVIITSIWTFLHSPTLMAQAPASTVAAADAPNATDSETKASTDEKTEDVSSDRKLDLKKYKDELFEMVGADESGNVRVVKYRDDFTGRDWFWASASGLGLGLGVGLAGGVIAAGASGSFDGIVMGLAVGTLSGMFLAPIGVGLYGSANEFSGSYFGAFVGGAGLGLLSLGLMSVTDLDPEIGYVGLSAIVIAPTVLGSVAGYFLSIDKRPSSAPRSASLLDYNPSDGLRLSVPALGYSNNNNDQKVRVSLFSGTF